MCLLKSIVWTHRILERICTDMGRAAFKSFEASPGVHARGVARSAVASTQIETPDLEELVTHYQAKLRLLDWRISVSYVPDLCAPDGQEVWGLCYPNVDAKKARILVRDPATPPTGETVEKARGAVEETVVHELVHLHMAPFQNSSPTAVAAEEQAVWAIAEALIQAKGTPDEERYARAMVAKVQGFAKARLAKTNQEKRMSVDPQKIANGFMIVGAKDGNKALKALEGILYDLVGGSGGSPDSPPSEPPAPPAQAAAPPAAPAPNQEDPTKSRVASEEVIFARAAMSLLGMTDPVEALAEIQRRRTAEPAPVAPPPRVELAVSDSTAHVRKALVARLVKIGVETPATAWADATVQEPSKRLADEPLSDLQSRVEMLEKSFGVRERSAPIQPPKSSASSGGGRKVMTRFGEVELTDREVRAAKSRRTDPAEAERFLLEYAENKAGNEHARGVRKL